MKTVSTNKAPAAIGPYSQAQIVGGMVYTSGQIGIDPATGIVPEGVEAQAHQVFKNLTELLQAAGSDMSKVVKTTVFIKDMNDLALSTAYTPSTSPNLILQEAASKSHVCPKTSSSSARS